MNKTIITDKKEAGIFAKKVIEQNIDKFSQFESPKLAYNYFKASYPNVNRTYDNFWSDLKVVKNSLGVVNTTKADKNMDNDVLDMPDIEVIKQVSVNDLEIKLYNPGEEPVNEEIFVPYKSGKFIDNIMSESIGCMPGTTIVLTGDASVGKTTLALDTLRNIKNEFIATLKKKIDISTAEKEFVYFSSEMKRIDIQYEEGKKEWMKDFSSILMNEYPKEQYKALVEKVLLHGYRVVVFDSFQDTVSRLNSFCGMSLKEASQFILKCIEKANMGETTTGHNTCVLLIQQVTKSGVFVGAHNLKHDTTAMLEFKFNKEDNTRYCTFTKNRRNGDILFKKLFYGLNEKKEVTYNTERWNEDRERENMITRERGNMEEAHGQFNDIFLNKTEYDNADDADDMEYCLTNNNNGKNLY